MWTMYLNDKVPSAAAENEEQMSRLRTITRKLLYSILLWAVQLPVSKSASLQDHVYL